MSINDSKALEGVKKNGQSRYRPCERRPPLLCSPEANIASAFARIDAMEMEPSTVQQALSGNQALG